MKNYWIALGESSSFTRDDHHIFKVFFTGQSGDKGWALMPRFVSSEDIEECRKRLHAFVDERIDHELHMRMLDKFGEEKQKKRDAFAAKPKVEDSQIDSISIGEFVGDAPVRKPITDGLLDLDKLV